METGQGVWLVSYCRHHRSLILTHPACNMSLPPAVSRTCFCLASLITALHSCLKHVPHSQCSVNSSWCVDEGAPTPVGSTFNYSPSMTSRWHLLPYPDIPMEPWSHGHLYVWLILDPHPQWQGCFLRHWGKKGNVRMWRKSGRVCKKVERKITFPTESGTSETQASSRWCGSTERFPEQSCKVEWCFYQRQTKTLSTSKAILPQLRPFALKVNLVGKACWLPILACPSLLLIKKP